MQAFSIILLLKLGVLKITGESAPSLVVELAYASLKVLEKVLFQETIIVVVGGRIGNIHSQMKLSLGKPRQARFTGDVGDPALSLLVLLSNAATSFQ